MAGPTRTGANVQVIILLTVAREAQMWRLRRSILFKRGGE